MSMKFGCRIKKHFGVVMHCLKVADCYMSIELPFLGVD
jgi:hypothetical protein